MRVVGVRRDPAAGGEGADEVHGMDRLHDLLPQADYVALTCALTPETRGLMGQAALARMQPSAILVNVARGRVADEAALVAALSSGSRGSGSR